jgi:uncharacterized membrane protein
MEAFSDGVIAIIITIMVLEMRPPEGTDLSELRSVLPVFLSYVLSFVYIGIYWNNHHHLLQASQQVNGSILWANIHLLFWLSLIPFVTSWMGDSRFAAWPVALYGVVMVAAGTAYFILSRVLIAHHGRDSTLAMALRRDIKSILSTVFYIAAIPLAFVNSALSCALFVIVAVMWLIPDRRIEKALAERVSELKEV